MLYHGPDGQDFFSLFLFGVSREFFGNGWHHSRGAIPTLCELLGSANDRAQKHAAAALASLALGKPENQEQVYLRFVQAHTPPRSTAPPVLSMAGGHFTGA